MKFRMKKRSTGIRFFMVIAAFVLACLVYSFIEPYLLRETTTVIADRDVPDAFVGKRIVFVSDFHLDTYSSPERIAEIVKRINAAGGDIVILGGDYVTDDEAYLAPCFAELAKLEAPLGVYGVTGNHDSVADYDLTVEYMEEAGIIPLENDARDIEIGEEKIRLGGVKTSYGEISDAEPTTDNTQEDDFIILVSHNPDFAEDVRTDRIDLMLSGHTHAGQITFFGLYAPYVPSDYGQKYLKGIVETPYTRVLVSSGVGTSALPMRFFAPPEYNVIVLDK